MQAPVAPTPPKACGLAVTSLVCGCLGLALAFIAGIPAIITGHMALGKIKRSGGTIGGGGIATTGLVLGYVTSTVLTLVWILVAALATPAIFKALERAEMAQNTNNVRNLQMAAQMHATDDEGKFPPDLLTLETEGYFPSLDALRYEESKTKHDWIYFAGHSDSDPIDTILIAAPMPTKDGKRIVGYLDGSARAIRESEYQRQLLKQQSAESPSGP